MAESLEQRRLPKWMSRTNYKIFSTYYAVGTIGFHDATAGALLPYIQVSGFCLSGNQQ